MTARNEDQKDASVLEEILETVQSIDENVHEILDQLSGYLDDTRYGSDLYEASYPDRHRCD